MSFIWRKLLFMVIAVALVAVTYVASGRFTPVLQEQQRRNDPLNVFTPQQAERQLQQLQQQLRKMPQDSIRWAELGEYYLYRNQFDHSLVAYRTALNLRGGNAQLYSAIATVLYYQANLQITAAVKQNIDLALALDPEEVSALMLLASDAFLRAEYVQAMGLWQQLLESNSPRINRAVVIEAINLAKIMTNNQQ